MRKKVLKTRIRDCAFSWFNFYNKNGAPLNLTQEEFPALKSLLKNEILVIQKLDKGNFIAIIEKSDYFKKMRNILSNSSKFTQVSIAEDEQLNFIVNVEKHITDLLEDLENSEIISENVSESFKPRRSRFGILYDLC